jgi:hypothetical protein
MRGGLQPDLLHDGGWWLTPALALRRVRVRHLQPGSGRAAGGPSRGSCASDRRSARPRAHRMTTVWSCGPRRADTRLLPRRMSRPA